MGKRVLVVILGVILLLVGASAALAGGALMAVFGPDSTLSSDQESVSTPTSALVAPIDDIKGTNGVATIVGQPTLRLSLNGSGRDVFIGIGPAAAVDRYLAGSSIDRVTDLEVDPFKLKTVTRDGSGTPAAPGTQTFWVARGSGSNASFTWKVKDGSYRLVVMNADGSRNVAAKASVGLKVPNLFAIGVSILIGGLLVVIAGVVVVVVGARMGRRQMPPMPHEPPPIKTFG